MSRMNVVNRETASPEQKELFDAIEGKLGMVPNFLAILANSPDALRAFLGLFSIAENGGLDPKTRERIALAIAERNGSAYCLSAHSALGANCGLSTEEMTANRQGSSHDNKAAAAVAYALALCEHRGEVTQAEFDTVRAAGYSDAEIAEIIVHTGMTMLTSLIGKSSLVDIDFPKVALLGQAA